MKIVRGLLTFAVGLLTAGCADGFFFEAAPASETPIQFGWTFAAEPGSVGDGPLAQGAAEAFDKVDAVRVRIAAVGSPTVPLIDDVLPVESAGDDKQISLSLDLEEPIQVTVEAGLLQTGGGSGGADVELFTANPFSLQLTPGEPAQASGTLVPVLGGLEILDVPTEMRADLSVPIRAVSTFPNGDVLRDLSNTEVSWEALTSNVYVDPDGVLFAFDAGPGRIRATWSPQQLSAEAQVDVFDPCLDPIPTIRFGVPVNDGLSRVDDCLADSNALADFYTFDVGGQTPFLMDLQSVGFEPFAITVSRSDGSLVAAERGGTDFGIRREFVLPAAGYALEVTSFESGTGLADAPEGDYALTLSPVSLAQEGCTEVSVVFLGSSVGARLGSNDCIEVFVDEPGVPRYADGYTVYAPSPSTQATIALSGDVPMDFSHWHQGQFLEILYNIPEGETGYFVGPADLEGYHSFYPLSPQSLGGGSYSLRFVEGAMPLLPNLTAARSQVPVTAQEAAVVGISIDVQNIAGPMPAALRFDTDIYISDTVDLTGQYGMLGTIPFTDQLDNAEFTGGFGAFELPDGFIGSFFIVAYVDAVGGVAEESEDNMFVIGEIAVTPVPGQIR
jgi:hypothetical protein